MSKEKRLWSGKFHYGRKWVDKWRPRQRHLGGLKMSLFVVGIPSFVQATPVAIRLWIVSQEQDLNPSPLPALVQLFPVWNWLLGFGRIKVFVCRAQCCTEKTAYLFTFGSIDAVKSHTPGLCKCQKEKVDQKHEEPKLSQRCTKECVVIRCFAVGVSDAGWQECAGEDELTSLHLESGLLWRCVVSGSGGVREGGTTWRKGVKKNK